MSLAPDALARARSAAARSAVAAVEDGMRVGLGTGGTADWMLRHLGARVRDEGLRIAGVATSRRTAEGAAREGIEVVDFDTVDALDLTIDGADAIDPGLALIKGGGGALLHEKIVAAASERMIVIADAGKTVARLGVFPVPVEVVPFGLAATRRLISGALARLDLAGRQIVLRESGGTPFVTEEGNRILDLHLEEIGDAPALASALGAIPGVVEHGLFIGMADAAVIGGDDGGVTWWSAEASEGAVRSASA